MQETRRGWMQWLLGGGIVASFLSFMYPVIRFMNPPDVAEAAVDEVTAGAVGDFALNTGKIIKFGRKPVILIRPDESEWLAFSATCTHLNCTVQYKAEEKRIWCACHNGFYDLSGKVLSGPPPRPLEEYTVHIRDDQVIVARRA